MLRTFLLFPFFFLAIKKRKWKSRSFFSRQKKAIHKTKITASIIKHSIIHINMYLEKGMNVVFHHHPNAIFIIFPPVFVYSFCVLLVFLFFYSESCKY